MSAAPPRNVDSRPVVVAVLVVGGVAGCLARYGLGLLLPTHAGGWPTGTFVVNLSGCLLLGFLLEHLARRGPDVGRRRLVRLGLGTGFLGTYTTYSTLAVEMEQLRGGGNLALAGAYGLASLVGGLAVAAAGVALAGWHARRVAAVVAGEDSE